MMVEIFVIVNVNKACSLQIPFIKILCCCIKSYSGYLIIYNVKTYFTYCYCSSGSNSEQNSDKDKYEGDFKWRGVFPSQLSTFQWNREAGTPPVIFCV
jgi:hypothetical protein